MLGRKRLVLWCSPSLPHLPIGHPKGVALRSVLLSVGCASAVPLPARFHFQHAPSSPDVSLHPLQ